MLTESVCDHVFNGRKNEGRAITYKKPEATCHLGATVKITARDLLYSKLRVIGMIPPTLTVQGLVIDHEACRSHCATKRCIIAGYHIEICRHECAVSVDGRGRTADQNRDTSDIFFIRRERIGEWSEGSKIFWRQ